MLNGSNRPTKQTIAVILLLSFFGAHEGKFLVCLFFEISLHFVQKLDGTDAPMLLLFMDMKHGACGICLVVNYWQ